MWWYGYTITASKDTTHGSVENINNVLLLLLLAVVVVVVV